MAAQLHGAFVAVMMTSMQCAEWSIRSLQQSLYRLHALICSMLCVMLQGNEAILRSASTMRHGAGREKKIPALYNQ